MLTCDSPDFGSSFELSNCHREIISLHKSFRVMVATKWHFYDEIDIFGNMAVWPEIDKGFSMNV